MTNRLSDLTDHLFAQIDRLALETDEDKLTQEIKRAEAIVAGADQIVRVTDLQLKAAKLFAAHGPAILPHLPLIGKAPEKAP